MAEDQKDFSVNKTVDQQLAEAHRQETLLHQSVETSRKATSSLIEYAVAHGTDKARFSHLEEVWKSEGFHLIPTEAMPKGMVAATAPATGEVYVGDKYADRFEAIFHESVHRAAHLGRKTNGTPSFLSQLATMYRYTIPEPGKIELVDSSSLQRFPEEERNDVLAIWYEELKKDREKLEEGLTEWTVQKSNGMKTIDNEDIKIKEEFRLYPDQVNAIETLKEKLQIYRKYTPEQAGTYLITAALTGNISDLANSVGGAFMVQAILGLTSLAHEGHVEL